MLIPKSEFIGLEQVVHLATGGESPALKSHERAVAQFFADKALGEGSRARQTAVMEATKAQLGQLLGLPAADLTFLSSTSEGINLIAHALEWRAGDNVVVMDVEFASDVLPWTRLADKGVEVRVVPHKEGWQIDLDDVAAVLDGRTRIVAASHVSYFTGQRLDVARLSEMVRGCGALLLLDVTHAAGAIAVDGRLADILVCSCYKWLLGVHGTAVFYVNPSRLPDLPPPFLGWNTGVTIPNWDAPTVFEVKPSADRFIPGNPSFISLYILNNALRHILEVGVQAIEGYVLHLSGKVLAGVAELGYALMTAAEPAARAGNVCFLADDVDGLVHKLEEQGILIWGGYAGVGRIRVSTHLYNSEADVGRFLSALRAL